MWRPDCVLTLLTSMTPTAGDQCIRTKYMGETGLMDQNDFNQVTASVKLVVWDLDETFWKGTLSEEGIQPIAQHVEMIKTLVDRGIFDLFKE